MQFLTLIAASKVMNENFNEVTILSLLVMLLLVNIDEKKRYFHNF